MSVFGKWFKSGIAPLIPSALFGAEGEEIVPECILRLPASGMVQSYLEIIRFAASELLYIDFTTKDRQAPLPTSNPRHTDRTNRRKSILW